jgi:hypothetical protein
LANEFKHKDPGTVLTQAEFIASDGTGHIFASQAQGDVLYASSTTVLSRLGKSTTSTHVLTNTGTNNNPAWAQVTLTSGVTGTLPVANGGTGITSLASNVATFLGTSTSANLRAALTDETGTGAAVFATSPTLVTPILGTPQSGVMTNVSGTASSLTSGNVTTNANLTGPVTSSGNATAIADKALAIAKLADGTDGELITWNASGVIAAVAVGTDTHVLTSNGSGAAPTFQAAAGTSLSGSTNNTVATVTGANALIGEANLTFDGTDLTVSSGNVIIGTAGKGIDFSAQTATSTGTVTSGKEVLDHYEEGTFTPSLQHADNSTISDQTYGGRSGFYTRIGDIVQFGIAVDMNALGSLTTGATAFIRGLPFSNTGGLGGIYVCGGAYGFAINDGDQVVGRGIESTDAIRMEVWGSVSATELLSVAAWSADGELLISGCYNVN